MQETLRDAGSIPGSRRYPGEENGNPLQVVTWRIPWTEESGKLQSMGLKRAGHDGVTTFTLWAACLFRGPETSWLGLLLVNLFLKPEGSGCVLTLISPGKPSMGSERKSIFYSHKSRERQRGGVKSRLHLGCPSGGFSHFKMRTSECSHPELLGRWNSLT